MSVSNDVTAPARSPAPKARLRTRYNAAMKVARRIHLYAGLFMTPWVLLYGVSAMLFNHPDAFPDREIRHFGPEQGIGTPLEKFPGAVQLAERVVAAMNADHGGEAPSARATQPYRLVRPNEARFTRDLFGTVAGEHGAEHSIRVDLLSGKGRVRLGEPEEPSSDQAEAPFSTDTPLPIDPSPRQLLKDGLPLVLSRLGLPGEVTISPRLSPDLEFFAEAADGTVWKVSYPITRGTLSGRPADAPGNSLSTRSFMLRLHTAHTYPSRIDARWFWALAVDAMFLSMVGWVATGLLMWCQMKNVRRVGAFVLVLSAIAATAVALGMHHALTS
ncbi:hypothetical protein [Tautonia rosea]|uniref:hypothetical protein n=1 Tax=Tautonia rosea TaxID=2728037 RepID=UPI0014764EE3|nr:hypothetical protein [Tautonia rosea]